MTSQIWGTRRSFPQKMSWTVEHWRSKPWASWRVDSKVPQVSGVTLGKSGKYKGADLIKDLTPLHIIEYIIHGTYTQTYTDMYIYIYNIVNIHTSMFLFQLDLMISCYFMLFHENFSALLPRPNCSGCHFVTCETAHKVQCEKVTEELTLKFCWYCFAFAAQTMWAQQWIAMACTASMIFHAFQDILSLSQPCQGWLSVVCPSDVRMHKSWKAIRGRHAGSTCDLWLVIWISWIACI